MKTGRPPLADDESILKATFIMFAEHGYDATSVSLINRKLGLSHSTIHQRFGNKKRLWYAAVDYGFKQFKDDLGIFIQREDIHSSDDLSSIKGMINSLIRVMAKHPEMLNLIYHEGISGSERLDEIFQRYIKPMIAYSDELLKRLQSQRDVISISSRELFFLVIYGAGAPFSLSGLSDKFNQIDSLLDSREHIESTTNFIMRGLTLK
jgi:AcrR family transcriptional regulator